MAQKFYDTAALGKMFDCDPHTIRDWIIHGCPTDNGRVKLPARKLGRPWKVTEEDLAVFLVRARSSSHGRPDLDLGKKEEIQEDGQ